MADYIKREDALFALCSTVHCGEEVPCRNQIVSCHWDATSVRDYAESILSIPSADVAPVKHGKNIADYPSLFRCSECEFDCHDTYTSNIVLWDYCPNCGAKMEDVTDV